MTFLAAYRMHHPSSPAYCNCQHSCCDAVAWIDSALYSTHHHLILHRQLQVGVRELLEQTELPNTFPVHREVVRESPANNFPQAPVVILVAALGVGSAASVAAAVLLGHGDATGHDAVREHRVVDLVVTIAQLRRACRGESIYR